MSLGPVFNHFAAAGGSSTKAFDPCLDTGEVGEGPAVEEVGEPVIESPVEAEKHTRGGRRRAPGGGGGGGMFEVNVSAGGLPEVVECSR